MSNISYNSFIVLCDKLKVIEDNLYDMIFIINYIVIYLIHFLFSEMSMYQYRNICL